MEDKRIFPKVYKNYQGTPEAGKYFEVFDALSATQPEYSGLTFSIFKHAPAPRISVSFRLDEEIFLCLRQLVLNRRIPIETEPQQKHEFTEFRGSRKEGYSTGFESRILSVSAEKAKTGGNTYRIEIVNGPGKEGITGQVMPTKAENPAERKSESFYLKENEMIAMVEKVYAYYQAFLARNFNDLREKLGERKELKQ